MVAVNITSGNGNVTPGGLFNSPINHFAGSGSHIDKMQKQTESLVSSPAGLAAAAVAGGIVNAGDGIVANGMGAPMHILAGLHDDGSSGYGSPDSLLSDGK